MVDEDTREILSSFVTDADIDSIRTVLFTKTQSEGWLQIWEILRGVIGKDLGSKWFQINKILLGVFGISELIGYDGDVTEVLDSIRDTKDFDEVERKVRKELINRVEKQLTTGGSTILFDENSMTTRQTAVLVSSLIKARKQELHVAVDSLNSQGFLEERSREEFDKEFDGSRFWGTAYGLKLLQGISIAIYQWFAFTQIRPALLELVDEFKIDISNPLSRQESVNNHSRMEKLAISIVSIYLHDCGVEERYYLYESGFIKPENILSYVIDNQSYEQSELELTGLGPISIMNARVLKSSATEVCGVKEYSEKVELLWRTLTMDQGIHNFTHSIFSDDESTYFKNMLETNLERAISGMIRNTNWEIHPEGCMSCQIDMWGLSISGFEIAVEMALDMGLFDIEEQMKATLSTLPWWEGNKLAAIGAKALVRMKGPDAIDILAKYATWTHRKFECGSYPDRAISAALSMLDSSAIPRLREQLFIHGYMDEGIMYEIAGMGQEGIEEIARTARQYFEPDSTIVMIEILARENYANITEIIVFALSELVSGHWDNEDEYVRKWIDRLPSDIDLSQTYQFLQSEDRALRIGTCVLLQHRPNQASVKLLIEDMENERRPLYHIKAVTQIDSIEIMKPVLTACLKMNNPEEYGSEAWLYLAEYTHRLGRDAVRILNEWLNHSDWEERIAPLVAIGLISKMEGGIALLESVGLKPLLAHFAADTLGYDKESRYPVYYWGWRAIALSRDLHFQIHDSEWKIKKIARAIKDSEDPPTVVKYISYVSELMENPIIIKAIENSS